MSEREIAKKLIDQIPESRLYYVISYLQGAAVPDEIPNAETIAALEELQSGGGELWTGSTEDFFATLDREVKEGACPQN